MASQGERVLGVLGMDEESLESMVQDEIPEQEMLVVQDELPQLNPEPEMGAAAAAAYDTSPSLLLTLPPLRSFFPVSFLPPGLLFCPSTLLLVSLHPNPISGYYCSVLSWSVLCSTSFTSLDCIVYTKERH